MQYFGTEYNNELSTLQEKLVSPNKVAVDVPADGNRLFASLAYQLHLSDSDIPTVRSEIVQYIKDNSEDFNKNFRLDIACKMAHLLSI